MESLVGYGRRNFMVPVPAFASWGELNAYLEQRCRDDLGRQLWGKPQGKAELLAVDRQALLPLPAESFAARRIALTRANSLSLVRFDRNDYSVPVAYAHHELTVSGTVEEVRITEKEELVAVHARIWERQRVIFDPLHYLALLERKPGALDVARPLERLAAAGLLRAPASPARVVARPAGHARVHQGAAPARARLAA